MYKYRILIAALAFIVAWFSIFALISAGAALVWDESFHEIVRAETWLSIYFLVGWLIPTILAENVYQDICDKH